MSEETKYKVSDFDFMTSLLPNYFITHDLTKKRWTCKSNTGIKNDIHWAKVVSRIMENFGENFSEIYHNTYTNHADFLVYEK